MRTLSRVVGRNFSNVRAPQFHNYFLVKLEYGPDGYYETYEHRKAFAEQLRKLEDEQQARVLGGDNFPKKSTTLIFNCNSIDVPNSFASTCVYSRKNLVTKSQVTELDQISGEKFEKVWQFYQPKLK